MTGVSASDCDSDGKCASEQHDMRAALVAKQENAGDSENEEHEDAAREDGDNEWAFVRRVRNMWRGVGDAARERKHDICALWLASRDERVPLAAKVSAYIALAAALSPIEVLPIVDDIVFVPLGIWLTIKLVPDDVWQEARERARDMDEQNLPSMWYATVVGVVVWVLIVLWLARNAWEVWHGAKKR